MINLLNKLQCITFIRHGHALPGKIDKSRTLSAQGQLQASQRALSLKSDHNFDVIITSSAIRTQETAKIILHALGFNTRSIEIEELYEPSSPSDKEIVNRLLDELGSVPLNIYHQHDTQGAWNRYASAAFDSLFKAVQHFNEKQILIVAHGNIINEIGLKLIGKSEILSNIYFNYCEGFEILNNELALLSKSNADCINHHPYKEG